MTRTPPLILPVENQTREFDAKLLLACVAAERGIPAILGCHARIGEQMHRLPRGIYMAKAVSKGSMKLFRIVMQLGHGLAAWDEEALVYMSPAMYLRRRVGPDSLGAPGALFAWGEDNAEIWRGAPGYRGQPLFATGNPRGDLLRADLRAFYAPAAEELRRRYGEFVLINSNFGSVNLYFSALTKPRLDLLRAAGSVEVPEEKVGTWDDPNMVAYRYALFQAFQEMLPALARRLPRQRIVLRPHPSENPEIWQRIAAPFPNVQVVGEGNAIPWLLAAQATVHNGCTTALESFLLGRSAIAYQPIADPVYDMPLPNALSRAASTVEELAAAIEGAAPDAAADPERARLAGRFVAAREGALASERIVDGLERLTEKGTLFERRALRDWIEGQIASRHREIKKRVRGLKKDSFDSAEYIQYRFPDLSAADVEARMDRLRAVTGRFGRVRARQRSKNVFELTAGR